MRRRGDRKYVCRDCNMLRMIPRIEHFRASGIRCMCCGGLMDAYSRGALEQLRVQGTALLGQDKRIRGLA